MDAGNMPGSFSSGWFRIMAGQYQVSTGVEDSGGASASGSVLFEQPWPVGYGKDPRAKLSSVPRWRSRKKQAGLADGGPRSIIMMLQPEAPAAQYYCSIIKARVLPASGYVS